MTIEWLRDLIIVISGVVVIVLAVFLGAMAFKVYRRINLILDSAQSAAATVEQFLKQIAELANPIAKIAGIIKGIWEGMHKAKKE